MKFGKLIGVLDVGTTVVRFVIFEAGKEIIICSHQIPIGTYRPRDNWCEQNANEIYQNVVGCAKVITERIKRLGASVDDIVAIGVTNQSGTVVVWDSQTGNPLYNAIVWMDNRAASTVNLLVEGVSNKFGNKIDHFRSICGLPLSAYFAAPKLRWLKDNVPAVRKAMDNNTAMFGTIDTWIIYNLTGGQCCGTHVTDVTNASRTMLMDIKTLNWDEQLLGFFGLPRSMLPTIRSTAEHYGSIFLETLHNIPITACLGNQQASLVGLQCLRAGQSKASFGANCSYMCNTGNTVVQSKNGLQTTVCYKLGPDGKAVYALEGSILSTGDAVAWLRDQMQVINNINEIEPMARSVANSLDVYFVPAFNGLYAPYWDQSACGVICGLTEEVTQEHIMRALLESTCFQIRDVQEALKKDFHTCDLKKVLVDGGMTESTLFLSLLAEILGSTVIRSKTPETTALGAALLAYKVLEPTFNMEKPLSRIEPSLTYKPFTKQSQRDECYGQWKKAIEHSMSYGDTQLNDGEKKQLEFEKHFQ